MTTQPKLRDDIELLRGMDNRPMIYDPVTGVYHHLSETSFALAKHFDGSRSTMDLAAALAHRRGVGVSTVLPELQMFVSALDRSGVLSGASVPPARRRRGVVMPRFIVTRSLARILEPLASSIRGWSGRLMWTVSFLGVAGIALGFGTLSSPAVTSLSWLTLAVIPLFLCQVIVHEMAHALVAQVLRTPVRGGGFALMFWVFPFAFVDRTDAYRLRRRADRVSLALAGPLSDGIFMGLTALTALGTGSPLAHQLLAVQAFSLFMNLNPVLAGDGYSALEAAFGLVDPRGRAFTLLRALVFRRPLPAHLATLGKWAQLAHLAYALACLAYFALGVTVLAGQWR